MPDFSRSVTECIDYVSLFSVQNFSAASRSLRSAYPLPSPFGLPIHTIPLSAITSSLAVYTDVATSMHLHDGSFCGQKFRCPKPARIKHGQNHASGVNSVGNRIPTGIQGDMAYSLSQGDVSEACPKEVCRFKWNALQAAGGRVRSSREAPSYTAHCSHPAMSPTAKLSARYKTCCDVFSTYV